MELFTRLFGNFLVFVYRCFDRIVIRGYLSNLSRPEQVVHFYKNLVGEKCITKELLGKRTKGYTAWVESYALNRKIPIQWAEKNVRKEEYVQDHLRRFIRRNTNGVYFIFKSMEQNRFFAITQIEYCRNFVFRRNFPIRKIFERSCELGLWRLTVDKISHIFGVRITKAFKGKLHTTLEKWEHGRHTLRAYWKSSFVKQYEKFSTFLRQEVCSNNLKDFRFKKGLDNLPQVREEFSAITERFTGLQAQALNVHVDFPLFQRIAQPVLVGTTKLARIKIQDTRMIRVMEILLHIGTQLSGWSMERIHRAIQERYGIDPESYTITQLRYDMRKMKAHGLVQRHGKQYRYRLTEKGVKVSLMFLFFHKRVCGPLANSLFQHQPNVRFQPESRLEKAYYKADAKIQKIIDLRHAA